MLRPSGLNRRSPPNESSNPLARLSVPDGRGVVIGHRHDAPTIGTESRARNDVAMFEDEGRLTRFHTPHARRMVQGCRNRALTIRAECDASH